MCLASPGLSERYSLGWMAQFLVESRLTSCTPGGQDLRRPGYTTEPIHGNEKHRLETYANKINLSSHSFHTIENIDFVGCLTTGFILAIKVLSHVWTITKGNSNSNERKGIYTGN